MGFDIIISDKSLKSCPKALCAPHLNEIFGYGLEDLSDWRGYCNVRKLNPDLLWFHFNNDIIIPTTPTDDKWACSYRYLNGSEFKTEDGQSIKTISEDSDYEFIRYYTKAEFIENSKKSVEHTLKTQWQALGEEEKPYSVEVGTKDSIKNICAKCSVKDNKWFDCQPRLMGASQVSDFLKGLHILINEIDRTKGQQKTSLEKLLTALQESELGKNDRSEEVLEAYNSFMDTLLKWSVRPLKLIGNMITRIFLGNSKSKIIFNGLVLRNEDDPIRKDEIDNLLPFINDLYGVSKKLAGSPNFLEKHKEFSEFHEIFEIYVKALNMTSKHNLEMSVSY